jgi:hypothetical protein
MLALPVTHRRDSYPSSWGVNRRDPLLNSHAVSVGWNHVCDGPVAWQPGDITGNHTDNREGLSIFWEMPFLFCIARERWEYISIQLLIKRKSKGDR